jgi:hypothetical protein
MTDIRRFGLAEGLGDQQQHNDQQQERFGAYTKNILKYTIEI